MKTRICLECGATFEPRQNSALFCSNVCRTHFHHRRRARGAELYDFIMAQTVRGAEYHGVIVRLVEAYRAADNSRRAGRQSWQPTQYALMNIPAAYGQSGDRR